MTAGQVFLGLDAMPMAAMLAVAWCCTLLGNFLLLRRQSMLADAQAHMVLPGIVLAFLFSGSQLNYPVLALGAFASTLAGSLAIQYLHQRPTPTTKHRRQKNC